MGTVLNVGDTVVDMPPIPGVPPPPIPPGVPYWRGQFTGSWWALLGDRLIEAADPVTLAHRIRQVLGEARNGHDASPRPRSVHRPSTGRAAAAVRPSVLPRPGRAAPRRDAPAPAPTRPAIRRATWLGRAGRLLGRAA